MPALMVAFTLRTIVIGAVLSREFEQTATVSSRFSPTMWYAILPQLLGTMTAAAIMDASPKSAAASWFLAIGCALAALLVGAWRLAWARLSAGAIALLIGMLLFHSRPTYVFLMRTAEGSLDGDTVSKICTPCLSQSGSLAWFGPHDLPNIRAVEYVASDATALETLFHAAFPPDGGLLLVEEQYAQKGSLVIGDLLSVEGRRAFPIAGLFRETSLVSRIAPEVAGTQVLIRYGLLSERADQPAGGLLVIKPVSSAGHRQLLKAVQTIVAATGGPVRTSVDAVRMAAPQQWLATAAAALSLLSILRSGRTATLWSACLIPAGYVGTIALAGDLLSCREILLDTAVYACAIGMFPVLKGVLEGMVGRTAEGR